jgi:hypothetical protein
LGGGVVLLVGERMSVRAGDWWERALL